MYNDLKQKTKQARDRWLWTISNDRIENTKPKRKWSNIIVFVEKMNKKKKMEKNMKQNYIE